MLPIHTMYVNGYVQQWIRVKCDLLFDRLVFTRIYDLLRIVSVQPSHEAMTRTEFSGQWTQRLWKGPDHSLVSELWLKLQSISDVVACGCYKLTRIRYIRWNLYLYGSKKGRTIIKYLIMNCSFFVIQLSILNHCFFIFFLQLRCWILN